MNNAAENIELCVPFPISAFGFFSDTYTYIHIYIYIYIHIYIYICIYLEVESLDHMIVLFSAFKENSILFSTMSAPICIPTSSV